MADFILLMHSDAERAPTPEMWGPYLAALGERGVFDGGSAIGEGETLRQGEPAAPLTHHITGYIRLQASLPRRRQDAGRRQPGVRMRRHGGGARTVARLKAGR